MYTSYRCSLYTTVGCLCNVQRSVDMRWFYFFFFQAEDGIRDLVRSRGLGDVYKRQPFGDVDGVDAEAGQEALVAQHVDRRLADRQVQHLSLIHI